MLDSKVSIGVGDENIMWTEGRRDGIDGWVMIDREE